MYDPFEDMVGTPLSDAKAVRAILIEAARERRAVTYSELLHLLGHRFTRPKMRAVCKTLDLIDQQAAMDGEPELAVLVVRESDKLPGQGWWVGAARDLNYAGPWEGREAIDFVAARQAITFAFWQG